MNTQLKIDYSRKGQNFKHKRTGKIVRISYETPFIVDFITDKGRSDSSRNFDRDYVKV